MTEQQILARLEATFEQEGLRFEILGRRERCLLVRAKRLGPGVPVAFLVKALEGTLRKYHPDLSEVELVEYDPGEGKATPEEPSAEFAKVLQHHSPLVKLNLPEVPGLDLVGSDRQQAIQALEQAHKMWSRQGVDRFRVRGWGEAPVRKAIEKWLTFYALADSHELEPDGNTLRIVLRGATQTEFPAGDTLWFPARLMLVGP